MSAPSWLDRTLYPFKGRTVTLASGRIHMLDEGGGPPVVMVHGTPEWSFGFRKLVQGLAANYRCIVPDQLGFGLSDKPPDADYRPERQAERLEALLDHLELDDVTLLVHDFGGPIGLAFAERNPGRVRGVVALNTWLWSLADEPRFRVAGALLGGPVGRLLYLYGNFSPRVMMTSAVADRRRSLPPEVFRHYLAPFPDAASRHAPYAYARALLGSSDFYDRLWRGREALRTLPALLLWGMRDPAFGSAALARMQLALPQAETVQLDAVGHFPQEEAPQQILPPLKRFLDRIDHPG